MNHEDLIALSASCIGVIALAVIIIEWIVRQRQRSKNSAKPGDNSSMQAPLGDEEQRVSLSSTYSEADLPNMSSFEDDDPFEITMMCELPEDVVGQLKGTDPDDTFRTASENLKAFTETSNTEPLILISGVAQTDRGLRRPYNEDAFLLMEEIPLFVVADGMGGYEGGEVAANMAVESIEEVFQETTIEDGSDLSKLAEQLSDALHRAHDRIHRKAQSDPKLNKMGTTVVAARFAKENRVIMITHVGDSRCYRVRGGALTQLTRDHTLSTLMGIEGRAGRKLTQAVGVRESVEVELNIDEAEPDDLYLVCSDGLTKMVDDDTLLQLALEEDDLEVKASRMVDEANRRGGRDNITVIVICVDRELAEEVTVP